MHRSLPYCNPPLNAPYTLCLIAFISHQIIPTFLWSLASVIWPRFYGLLIKPFGFGNRCEARRARLRPIGVISEYWTPRSAIKKVRGYTIRVELDAVLYAIRVACFEYYDLLLVKINSVLLEYISTVLTRWKIHHYKLIHRTELKCLELNWNV